MPVGEEFHFYTSLLPSHKANSCKLFEVLGSDDRVFTTSCTGWISCWFSNKQDRSGINITVVVTVTVTKCLVHILPQLWGFHVFLLTAAPKQHVCVCFQGSCRTVWLIPETWSSPVKSVTQQLSCILRLYNQNTHLDSWQGQIYATSLLAYPHGFRQRFFCL